MTKVSIVHSNVSPSNLLDVHAAGCQDVKRFRASDVYTEDHASIQTMVETWYGDMYDDEDEWSDYVSEFRFMPCSPLNP